MDNGNKPTSIFDDYSEVKECIDCEHWWTNACDSSEGATRPCNAFKPTRRVSLPKDVERLRTRLDLLSWAVVLVALVQIALLIWR